MGLGLGEHGGHVRSWIWRSFKNVLVRRLLCGGALSSTTTSTCLCQGAPCNVARVHVVQHVVLGVDAHILFDEARRENDAVQGTDDENHMSLKTQKKTPWHRRKKCPLTH